MQRALEKDKSNRALLREKTRIQERRDSLTPREREILELMTRGKPNKVMAADLGVSQRTVEQHLRAIYGKLGVSTRTAAARAAAECGLA